MVVVESCVAGLAGVQIEGRSGKANLTKFSQQYRIIPYLTYTFNRVRTILEENLLARGTCFRNLVEECKQLSNMDFQKVYFSFVVVEPVHCTE